MDRYFVLGNPVAHSLSPRIHALFAAQTGQALQYTRLEVPLDGFAASVARLQAEGVKGCNITVPFKEQAFAWAQTKTPRALLAQAGNTLVFAADGSALLDNTDGIGLVRDVQDNAGVPLCAKRILLIGAGGAAAGALGALLACQPARIVLSNRTAARADALLQAHAAHAQDCAPLARMQACGLTDLHLAVPELGPFDVVINASAASLGGQTLDLPPHLFAPGALAYDMMYGQKAQPFLAWAAAQGAYTRDGLGMLVEQAAEAFFVWRKLRPQTQPVLSALRAQA